MVFPVPAHLPAIIAADSQNSMRVSPSYGSPHQRCIRDWICVQGQETFGAHLFQASNLKQKVLENLGATWDSALLQGHILRFKPPTFTYLPTDDIPFCPQRGDPLRTSSMIIYA